MFAHLHLVSENHATALAFLSCKSREHRGALCGVPEVLSQLNSFKVNA